MQNSTQQKRPIHPDIACRAYLIWEKKGRPHGQDVECWLEAEQQLLHPGSKPQPRKAVKVSRSVQPVRSNPAFAQAAGF